MDIEFEELQSQTLRELFVKQMEGMILSGKLPIGAKIPTERELSDKMKVSRAIVNGGLSDMEAKGFLQVVPRKGTYVANYKYKGKLDILKSIMEYNGEEFDPDMIVSFMQVRRDIEGSSTYFAALNRRDEDLEIMESQLNAIENADSVEELTEMSFKFHHAVCISSGNMIYPLMYYSFKPIISTLMKDYYEIAGREGMAVGIKTMRLLYECILAKDAKKAKDTIIKSIERGELILSKEASKNNRTKPTD